MGVSINSISNLEKSHALSFLVKHAMKSLLNLNCLNKNSSCYPNQNSISYVENLLIHVTT